MSRIEFIKNHIDFIFNKSKGFGGVDRKSSVPVICELLKKPYLGSNAFTLSLTRNNFFCSQVLSGLGLTIPHSKLLCTQGKNDIGGMNFPLIVKPNNLSTSMGIENSSLVFTEVECIKHMNKLWSKYNGDILLEEFICGKEYKVAVIGNNEKAHIAGCVEVLKNGSSMESNFVTNEDIFNGNITYKPVKQIGSEIECLSLDAYKGLQLKDYGRIDIRLSSKDNKIFIIEISPHAEINVKSAFIEAARSTYLSYDTIIRAISEAAVYG